MKNRNFGINRKLGIIGGSGLYKIEGFENTKWKKVETSWGKPSDSIMTAKFYGNEIFLFQGIQGDTKLVQLI